MSENIQTIILNTLFAKWNENSNLFNALPEFGFVPPLAQKIKDKGCTCGLGGEISNATTAFNVVVQSLSDESVIRMKTLFKVEKLCFGIQSKDSFDVKCY